MSDKTQTQTGAEIVRAESQTGSLHSTTSSRKKDKIKEKTANRTLVSALTNFNLDDHGFNLDNLTFEHDSDSDDDIFSGYVPGLEPLPLAAPSGTAESTHNLHQPLSLGLGGVPVAGSYASASLAAAVPTGSCMYQHQYQQSSFQQTQEHSFNTSASVASTAGRNSHSGVANKIKVGNKQDDKTEENKEPAVKLNLDKLLFSAEYAIARAREMNNKGNTRAPGGAANKSKALKERVKAEKDARREKMEKEAKEKTEAALKGDGVVEEKKASAPQSLRGSQEGCVNSDGRKTTTKSKTPKMNKDKEDQVRTSPGAEAVSEKKSRRAESESATTHSVKKTEKILLSQLEKEMEKEAQCAKASGKSAATRSTTATAMGTHSQSVQSVSLGLGVNVNEQRLTNVNASPQPLAPVYGHGYGGYEYNGNEGYADYLSSLSMPVPVQQQQANAHAGTGGAEADMDASLSPLADALAYFMESHALEGSGGSGGSVGQGVLPYPTPPIGVQADAFGVHAHQHPYSYSPVTAVKTTMPNMGMPMGMPLDMDELLPVFEPELSGTQQQQQMEQMEQFGLEQELLKKDFASLKTWSTLETDEEKATLPIPIAAPASAHTKGYVHHARGHISHEIAQATFITREQAQAKINASINAAPAPITSTSSLGAAPGLSADAAGETGLGTNAHATGMNGVGVEEIGQIPLAAVNVPGADAETQRLVYQAMQRNMEVRKQVFEGN